jgi:hypothetical protein
MFLLKPSAVLRDRIYGIIGRAQRLTGVRIHGLNFQSNHHHITFSVRDAGQMADFMRRVQGQISVELRVLRGWFGSAWQGRYLNTLVAHHEADQARRFRYLLGQGCKAGLIHSPKQWPGASSVTALCRGEFELEGTWIDRGAMSRAERSTARAKKIREEDFATKEKIVLTKLPGFDHLSDDEYASWVRSLVEDIEIETQERHRKNGTKPLGVWNVMRVSPTRIPKKVAWGPRPRIIASRKDDFNRLWQAWKEVSTAHGEASARLRAGKSEPAFPEGTFPSRGPFVSVQAGRAGP